MPTVSNRTKELVFHTVNGREVYGGGGIMPDIFVPRDTTGVTSYFNNVANEGLLYQYAFDYTDKYRDKLSTAKDVESLLNILEPNTLLNSFVQYAAQKGIRPPSRLHQYFKKINRKHVAGIHSRNILGEEAFYKLLLRDDETLRKARDIVNKGEGYPELPAENQVPR